MPTYNVLVVYNAEGRILRTQGTEASSGIDPATLVAPGEEYLLTTETDPLSVNAATHYVDGGELVPYPPQPTRFHVFNFVTHVWELDLAGAWAAVYKKRDELLRGSDWHLLPDSPDPLPVQQQWRDYRDLLRQVHTQPDPLNIVWPTPPA